jgi:hypothetical protein
MVDTNLRENVSAILYSLESRFIHNCSCRRFYPTHDMLWFDELPLYPCFRVVYPTNDECRPVTPKR